MVLLRSCSCQAGRERYYEDRKRREDENDRQCVVAERTGKRHDADRTVVSEGHPAGCVEVESGDGDMDLLVANYAEARKTRCALFLSKLRKKQEDYFNELCS